MELLQIAELIEKDYTSDYKDYYRGYDFYTSLIEEYGKDKGNKMTVLISYLYDKNSHLLNTKLGRREVKLNLIKTLGLKLDDDFLQFVDNEKGEDDDTKARLKVLNDAVEEYLDAQKDWRFKQVMFYYDFHALTMRVSKNDVKDPKQLVDIGKALKEGEDRRRDGDAILQQIEKDFASLNGILVQENRQKIKIADSWEDFIDQQ